MTKFQHKQAKQYENGDSAYELGAEAALDGRKIKDCPFFDGRKLAWRNGFRDYAE